MKHVPYCERCEEYMNVALRASGITFYECSKCHAKVSIRKPVKKKKLSEIVKPYLEDVEI